MHEINLINSILNDLFRIAKEQNAKKITKIYLAVGELSELTPGILIYHLKEKTKKTIAENAEIDIKPGKKREIRLISFDCE